jgi:hypothetical protein
MISMHCWREGRIALILHARQAAKIEAVCATRGLRQGRAPNDHERGTRHCVQAFIRGRGYGAQAVVCEVDGFRSETAHGIRS